MKTCSKCKVEKEVAEFGKEKLGKGGLMSRCKSCVKQYNLDNKDKRAERMKQYQINNREKFVEYKKQHYLVNKEEILKRSKQHYLNNKEIVKHKVKQYSLCNRETIIIKRKQHYLVNKEEILKKQNQYHLDNKDKSKQYRLDNKEKIKQYRLDNKEKIKQYRKQYYLENKDKKINYGKQYRLDNKQKLNERVRNRKQTDSLFKLRCNIRNLISMQMKKQGYPKTSKTQQILGCDFETFKAHLEKQFTKGMNWNNQGEWHLDHIYPVSLAKDEAHLIELNHYTNFQPLWAIDNLKKGNKIQEKQLFLI